MVPCNVCVDLTDKDKVINANDLYSSKAAGCEACCVLVESLDVLHPKQRQVQTVQLGFNLNEGGCLTMIAEGSGTGYSGDGYVSWRRFIELYTPPGVVSKWTTIGQARPLEQDTSSEGCFKIIQSWIQECNDSHTDCRFSHEALLPTRVIRVGLWNEDPNLHIAELGECGRYAALSHCWGKHLLFTTTTATLSDRKICIPYSSLPKTFQNAVLIARQLNIPYLWIDALCIIQDSAEDWAREASRMASVYKHAYLTIVAADAKDSSQGCFNPLPGKRNGIKIIRTTDHDDNEIYIHARHRTCDFGRFFDFSDLSPIGSRAWVLQEQLLSPRLLRYAGKDLSWICNTCSCCECSIQVGPKIRNDNYRDLSDSTHENSIWNEWMRIVESFSRKRLTYDSDKLPAISALARDFQDRCQSEYLAGLWRGDLARGLLWTSERPDFAHRHATYYAPSWAWASLIGPVAYNIIEFDVDPVIDVVDVAVIASTANPYGPASGAYLEVSGSVVDVDLCTSKRFLDGTTFEVLHAVSKKSTQSTPLKGEVDCDITGPLVNLLLLLIARCTLENADDPEDFPAGLILKESEANVGGYERIGILNPSTWSYDKEQPEGRWLDWLADAKRQTLTIH